MKTISLNEVLTERKQYALKNEKYPHVSFTKEGIFPKNEQFDRDFLVKKEDKKYKVTHFGDLCYNPAN